MCPESFGGSDLTFDPSFKVKCGQLILLVPCISFIIGLYFRTFGM